MDLARLLTEQDTTRTIGHQVELARLQVPASLDKAALWLQQQVFKELQAGEGELRQHDIRDESSSRIQDKEEGLGNAIAWLAARGLPCENLHSNRARKPCPSWLTATRSGAEGAPFGRGGMALWRQANRLAILSLCPVVRLLNRFGCCAFA